MMVCSSCRFICMLPSPDTIINSSRSAATQAPMAAGRSYPMEAMAELVMNRCPFLIT